MNLYLPFLQFSTLPSLLSPTLSNALCLFNLQIPLYEPLVYVFEMETLKSWRMKTFDLGEERNSLSSCPPEISTPSLVYFPQMRQLPLVESRIEYLRRNS